MVEREDETFNQDFSRWGVQTSLGLGTGFVLGFVKGFRESSHLAGKYGPNNVYYGSWATFRVPLNIMHATGSSALWGTKVGFFVSSFSAIQIFLDRKRINALRNLPENNNDINFYESVLKHEYSNFLPTAGAGCFVGGLFGLSGGALSCIRGSAAGLALSMSIGGLQLGLSTASRRLEEELRQRQADVSTLSTGNRVPVSTVPGAKG